MWYFAFIDIFHALIIPVKMTIPWNNKKIRDSSSKFYVRKPLVLVPRRNIAESQEMTRNFNRQPDGTHVHHLSSPPAIPQPLVIRVQPVGGDFSSTSAHIRQNRESLSSTCDQIATTSHVHPPISDPTEVVSPRPPPSSHTRSFIYI